MKNGKKRGKRRITSEKKAVFCLPFFPIFLSSGARTRLPDSLSPVYVLEHSAKPGSPSSIDDIFRTLDRRNSRNRGTAIWERTFSTSFLVYVALVQFMKKLALNDVNSQRGLIYQNFTGGCKFLRNSNVTEIHDEDMLTWFACSFW